MRNRFFLFLTILLFNTAISGAWDLDLRTRGIIHVRDTAQNEVVYVHIAIDPKKNNARKVTYEMLTIGNRLRYYGGYDDYQLDSIFMAQPDLDLNHEDYHNLAKNYEQTYVSVSIDPANDLLTYYGKIFINRYRYTEPIPEIDWQLSQETQEVMGYECHKATARWRGRDWTAWYSDIPVDAGPWKFQGLPGLILKLEDATGQHYFEAIGTKEDKYPFGYKDKLYCKITREKYEAELEDYSANFGKVLADSGMILESEEHLAKLRKSPKRSFHSPIELE